MMAARLPEHDPSLPRLEQALDPDHMLKQFEPALLAGHAPGRENASTRYRLLGCQIGRIKYKRGFRCTIGYRLSVEDRRNAETFEHRLSGRLYAPGEAHSHFESATRKPLVDPVFGPPMFELPSLDMVVWSFPNDRKMKGLASITDTEVLREELLPAIIREHWGGTWSIDSVSHSIASYVPEGRCCVRAVLDLRNTMDGQTRSWTLFGKAYCGDRGERGRRSLQKLWQLAPSFGMPRPVGYQADRKLYWQEAVAGRPLADLAMNRTTLSMAADAVAALHRTPFQGPYRITMPDVAVALQKTESQLSHALGAQRVALAATIRLMVEQSGQIDSDVAATIHRDLHHYNILIDGDRASLIDLDDICIGPPLHDIGSFIARILYQALCDGSPQDDTRQIIATFVDRYRRQVDWPVHDREIAWYTAVALINERVFRRITHLDVEQPAMLERVVALAGRIARPDGGMMGLGNHV